MFLKRLEILASDPSTSTISALSQKLLKKYFAQVGTIPVPLIKVVNDPKSRWLGRCIYNPKKTLETTTIEIQKRILGDEKTLKRTLAHELIHHVEFLTQRLKSPPRFSRQGGHGEFFKKWARKISSVESLPNFVSEKSDMTYVETAEHPFVLVILPVEKKKFGFMWSPGSLSSKATEAVKALGGKALKTRDLRWTHGEKVNQNGRYSLPLDGRDEKQLEELFRKAS